MLQFVAPLGQSGVVPGLSEFADPAVFGQRPARFTKASGNHIKDRAVESRRHILFQRGHADALPPPDITAVRKYFAAQEFQQGGLAHTVATHQAHALPFCDLEGYVFQQWELTESPAHIPHIDQSHKAYLFEAKDLIAGRRF